MEQSRAQENFDTLLSCIQCRDVERAVREANRMAEENGMSSDQWSSIHISSMLSLQQIKSQFTQGRGLQECRKEMWREIVRWMLHIAVPPSQQERAA